MIMMQWKNSRPNDSVILLIFPFPLYWYKDACYDFVLVVIGVIHIIRLDHLSVTSMLVKSCCFRSGFIEQFSVSLCRRHYI